MNLTIENLSEAAKKFSGLREEVERLTSTINPVEMITPQGIGEIKKRVDQESEEGFFYEPSVLLRRSTT